MNCNNLTFSPVPIMTVAIAKAYGDLVRACFALAVVVCAGLASAVEAAPSELDSAKSEPARVEIRGDTVYYTGNMSEASGRVFDNAIKGIRPGQVTRMVIRSGGGDTVAGRRVGRWVQQMGIVVEVDLICFSSCANYVFPAGRARVIRADAFVGWHGNDRQFSVIAARTGVPISEQIRRKAPPDAPKDQVDAWVRDAMEVSATNQKDEALFYAQLGLKDTFAVCAVGDDVEERFGFAGRKGWGFSVEDMIAFGLTNTVYLGSGRYERDSKGFARYLSQISADDCRSLLP